MADEAVKINVSIDPAQAKSGAAAAKQAVESVGQAADAAGQAGQAAGQAGKGMEELGKGTGKAGAEMFDFHKKGEKLVKEMLGILNPSLAQGADLALDLAEGVSKITPALVAVATVGAATGIIAALFNQANAEAAALEKRLNDALANRQGAREAVTGQTAAVAKQLAAVGVADSDAARRIAVETEQEMAAVGGDRAMIQQSRVIQRLLGLSEDDRQRVLAGIVVAGGKPVDLSGDDQQDRTKIDKLLEAGSGESAASRLREYRESTRGAARADAKVTGDSEAERRAAEVDSIIAQMRGDGRLANDRDEQIVREMLDKQKQVHDFIGIGQSLWASAAEYFFDPANQQFEGNPGTRRRWREMFSAGSTRTLGELEALARQAREEAARAVSEQAATPGMSGPVLIIKDRTTNIGTLNQRLGDPPAFNPSLAAHEGID